MFRPRSLPCTVRVSHEAASKVGAISIHSNRSGHAHRRWKTRAPDCCDLGRAGVVVETAVPVDLGGGHRGALVRSPDGLLVELVD